VIVMFFSGSDPFARIVQLVTRSKINHVGIAIEGVYYEATRKGVVHQVLDAPVPLYTRQLPDADLVQRFLNRQVGKQYGVLELVSCWLSAILGIVFYCCITGRGSILSKGPKTHDTPGCMGVATGSSTYGAIHLALTVSPLG